MTTQTQTQDWPTFRGNNSRTGFVDFSTGIKKNYRIFFQQCGEDKPSCLTILNENGELVNKVETNGVSKEEPVIAGKSIVINGHCYDFNGNLLWKYPVDWVNPIYSNGELFFSVNDEIHVLSEKGELKRKIKAKEKIAYLNSDRNKIYCSIETILEKMDYTIGDFYEGAGELMKFSLENGLQWDIKQRTPALESPWYGEHWQFKNPIFTKNSAIFQTYSWIGDNCGWGNSIAGLLCLDNDGKIKWEYFNEPDKIDVRVPLAFDGNNIYAIQNLRSINSHLLVLNEEGNVHFKMPVNISTNFCISNGSVLFFRGRNFQKFNKNIEKILDVPFDTRKDSLRDCFDPYFSGLVTAFDNKVLCGTKNQWSTYEDLYCINETNGEIIWKYPLDRLNLSGIVAVAFEE